MGSDLVVFDDPIFGYFSDLREPSKNIIIQYFIAISSIESLYEGILGWFSWLDEFKSDLIVLGPSCQLDRDKLRPVVHS